jgi:carbohydrate-binding DOMON domain-containing protein
VADQPAPPPGRTPARPVDADHALRIGWVAGVLASAAEQEPLSGVKTRGVEILDDDNGNHLDAIRLYAPSGTYLVSIERESYR